MHWVSTYCNDVSVDIVSVTCTLGDHKLRSQSKERAAENIFGINYIGLHRAQHLQPAET